MILHCSNRMHYISIYISTMYRTIYCICLLRVKFFVILNKQFAFNLYVGVVVVSIVSIVRVFIVHLFIANWWILKIGLLRAKGGNDRLHLFYHYRFSHHFINYDRCFISLVFFFVAYSALSRNLFINYFDLQLSSLFAHRLSHCQLNYVCFIKLNMLIAPDEFRFS